MGRSLAHSVTLPQESTMQALSGDIGGLNGSSTLEASPFADSGLHTQVTWNQDTTPPPPAPSTNPATTSYAPSTFPQSTFDFTLPLCSDELGRLPLWSDEGTGPVVNNPAGVTWPPSTHDQATNFGSAVDNLVYDRTDEQQTQMDTDIEMIFAAFLPDNAYEQALGIMSDAGFPYFSQPQNTVQPAGGSDQYVNPSFNYFSGPPTGGQSAPDWV